MSHSVTSVGKIRKFSVLLFVTIILSSVAVYLAAFALIAPAVWQTQLHASFISHVVVFLVCHLAYGLFEHPFHRYVLHSPLIPGLSRFYKSHTRHHGLTSITYREIGVRNFYPIIIEKQHEVSFFPWYSYLVFILVMTPFLILAQWIFPSAPIFLEGALALAWSISLYEILHAIEHKDFDKVWLPKLEHHNPYLRKFWRIVYAFHLRHHADIKCNEGISGFFGIPIADFLFGTWVNPNTLYIHGSVVDKKEFESPKPVFFIQLLDDFAEKRKQKMRIKKRTAV
jgi:hemolysin III